ncbi:MAG TPA: alpha/beta fold hydrolase [Opitutaceae bacterium]|nr:alpha/beta fold hydrolase [Opitutaceae bacterium]
MKFTSRLPVAIAALMLAARLPAADASPSPGSRSDQANSKFTFVLVHGAWAGGWEWKKVDQALSQRGHTVHRLTLTGQGEKVHLANADIDLDTHIKDVTNVLAWEDLKNVVLVGHSYGGMVITGVVDQMPERFKHVIYVDAFLPENGESLDTALGRKGSERPAENGFVSLRGNQDGKPLPHTVRQSAKTFSQPIVLKNQEAARKVPTTYILTADKAAAPEKDGFYGHYQRAAARGWKTLIMEGDHIVHLTRTKELVHLLEQAVEPAPAKPR